MFPLHNVPIQAPAKGLLWEIGQVVTTFSCMSSQSCLPHKLLIVLGQMTGTYWHEAEPGPYMHVSVKKNLTGRDFIPIPSFPFTQPQAL